MTNPTKESLEIAKDIAKKVVPGFLLVPYGATKKGEPLLSGLIIKHTAQALSSYAKTQFERARSLEFYRATDYLRKLCWSEKDIKAFHDWGRTYKLPEDKR